MYSGLGDDMTHAEIQICEGREVLHIIAELYSVSALASVYTLE